MNSFWIAAMLAGLLWASSAAGVPISDLRTRILQLEDAGRAQPYEAAANLDSLLPSTPEFGPERLELLTVQGLMLAVAMRTDQAERSAAKLELWSRIPGANTAPLAAAAASLIRARSLALAGNLQLADATLQGATDRLPASLLPRDRWRFLNVHGYIKGESGKLEDAIRIQHEALALADRQDETWRRAETRTTLANHYYLAKQFPRALALIDESIALAEPKRDWRSLGRAHLTEGFVKDALGDLDGERKSLELALEYARRSGSKIDETRYLPNLADFFLKTGDYATALQQAERALPLARELKDTDSERAALTNLGLAHISLKHFDIGKRYVDEALVIYERRGSHAGAASVLQEEGAYLEKAGDAAGAVVAYHRYRRSIDEMLRDSQQKAILAIQEQFDADRRTRSLALLNRENEIKAAQLQRRDLQERMWWLLAATVGVSFAVLVALYRRVRLANRLLAATNQALLAQSERDPLTGLANRRHFHSALDRLAVDGTLTGTAYLIDIDHFKHINDRHSHGAGDAVLIEVGQRLRSTLREQDLIVRWGGEEFLVVVQSTDAGKADALAQRMLDALDAAPVKAEGLRIPVTGSIGYASFPIGPSQMGVSWERAVRLVDAAMYLAKANGRNRAYGVRLLRAGDEASLDGAMASLESAANEGLVALTLLQGRIRFAAAA